MTSKATSVRFDTKKLQEIDSFCEKEGCLRNDFVNDALDMYLVSKRAQNNGTKLPQQDPREPREESKEEPKLKEKPKVVFDLDRNVTKYYDSNAKYLYEVQDDKRTPITEPAHKAELILDEPKRIDNSNKPPIQMTYFNGKLLSYAERYNI